jgi:hypothetical protein
MSCVRCLKHWSTTLAGVRDFSSVMEVMHASAVQEFKQAVRYNTADGIWEWVGSDSVSLRTIKCN